MSPLLPEGCGVALVTPFQSDGTQDLPALRHMVEHVLAGGVDFIVVLGTTGEAAAQTTEEHFQVLQTIHDQVNGRVPLVAGPFGGSGTQSVIDRMVAYADILALPGYVALMSAVPSYVKPSQEGLYQHFMALAEASPLPILLYNVPGRTGVNMTAETTVRLAKSSTKFIGVKEASGDMSQGVELLRDSPQNFSIYSGDDPTAMTLIAAGARGIISVVANAYPRMFSEMSRAAVNGNLNKARRFNAPFIDVHPLLYVDGNPSGIKAVLDQLGHCSDTVRLPLVAVSEDTRQSLALEVLKLEAARVPGLA
ncbi:MAG: 4-hydroxy-tetrahydrodipicolinate synthase [Saprospiraceae bacterium]